MSQSVARLKQLLFDDEAQALADLTRRIEATSLEGAQNRDNLTSRITAVSEADAQGRAELRAAIDEAIARAVTADQMTDSVATVLNDALRKAEVSQHAELSASIAPLVVTTIKAELVNSQDEMVEALYPLTGRMVKAYVATAMKDLADQMNRRIEQTSFVMRLRSLLTGRSMAELAMVDIQDFQVNDLLLIRRGSGELLARWPGDAGSGREQAISGVLAAINEFADEAFSADQDQLRQIDLGGHEIYLRASPKFLLAARCSGVAPASIEPLIDDAFLTVIERQHALDPEMRDGGSEAQTSALATVGCELEAQLDGAKSRLKTPATGGALKALALLVLMPILCWLAYTWYDDFTVSQARRTAADTVADTSALRGYPVEIDVAPFGRRITVSGLVPSEDVRFAVAHGLRRNLPGAAVIDQLAVVPGADAQPAALPPDLTSDVAALREQITNMAPRQVLNLALHSLDRSHSLLRSAHDDLMRSSALASAPERRSTLDTIASETRLLGEKLSDARSALAKASTPLETAVTQQALTATTAEMTSLVSLLAAVVSPTGSAGPRTVAPENANTNLGETIESVRTLAERIAALAVVASIAVMPPQQQPVSATPAAPPHVPTARERLESAARAKAIFFDNGIEYRNVDEVAQTMATLVPLVKEAGVLVRVVGYTDEAGGAAINSPLAQQRADRVRNELITLGAPENLVTAVGRMDRFEISAANGPSSPNRRVEFEVGFDGEAAP
ncbi:MAG: OmpA family protein [Hyphomicrobium sp.]